jgi:hypothetical protein
MVPKAGQFVTASAAMGVHGQFFEGRRDAQQKNGIT